MKLPPPLYRTVGPPLSAPSIFRGPATKQTVILPLLFLRHPLVASKCRFRRHLAPTLPSHSSFSLCPKDFRPPSFLLVPISKPPFPLPRYPPVPCFCLRGFCTSRPSPPNETRYIYHFYPLFVFILTPFSPPRPTASVPFPPGTHTPLTLPSAVVFFPPPPPVSGPPTGEPRSAFAYCWSLSVFSIFSYKYSL